MDPSAEQEARQREAQERERGVVRPKRRRLIGLVVGSAALLAGAGITSVLLLSHTVSSGSVSGRTSAPPWAAPADVEQRAKDAGLSLLTAEGEVLHIHEHLSITVDGTAVQVPALIGIDEAKKRISAIHTHDTTGIIHVESPVVKTFYLGQVFTEWDVALGAGRVGTYRDGQGGVRVAVFVDLRRYRGDPTRIVLGERQNIDVVVTTDGSSPKAPATAFRFPSNY